MLLLDDANMDVVEALQGALWAAKAFLQQLDHNNNEYDEDACVTLDHTLHFIHTTYTDLMTTTNGNMEA